MSEKRPGDAESAHDPAPTALARFLDTVVPAKFPSDAALARAAGVNRSLIARWRRGLNPSPANLYALAKATGVSVEYLVTIVGYDKSSGGSGKSG